MPDHLLGTPLYRWLIRLLPVGVVVSIAGFSLGTWQIVHTVREERHTSHTLRLLGQQGAQAHHAICVLRADLERRVLAGRAFLREHPEGFAAIPTVVILKSLNDQQAAVDSLATVDCAP